MFLSITLLNPGACDRVEAKDLRDASNLNPGQRIFMANALQPIYRGINQMLGSIVVTIKKTKRPKRILNLEMKLFADRMRARRSVMRVQLAKKGFTVQERESGFLY